MADHNSWDGQHPVTTRDWEWNRYAPICRIWNSQLRDVSNCCTRYKSDYGLKSFAVQTRTLGDYQRFVVELQPRKWTGLDTKKVKSMRESVQPTYSDKCKVCNVELRMTLGEPRWDGDSKVLVGWLILLVVLRLVRALIHDVAKGICRRFAGRIGAWSDGDDYRYINWASKRVLFHAWLSWTLSERKKRRTGRSSSTVKFLPGWTTLPFWG